MSKFSTRDFFGVFRMTAAIVAFAIVITEIVNAADVQVIVTGAQKHLFAVTGFTGDAGVAGPVTEVLKNDLSWSGHFQLTPAANAEYVQQGIVRVERGQGAVECTVTLRATKEVVLSKSYSGSEQDLRRMVHKLSDDIVAKITGERGIAQTKIAFVLSRGGTKELAVMDYDGHSAKQLTYDKSLSVRPRWSPDGRKIIYTSYLSVFPDVLAVDLVTGQRKKMSNFPGLNTGAVFSPNGRTVALTLSKDGNPELYTMDADGGGFRRMTHTKGAESSPTWSPDGEYIAYVSDDGGSPQVYMIQKDGGEPQRLTVSPSYNTEPDWSRPPATSQLKPMLAVTSRVGGKFQIGLYDIVTREVKMLTDDGDADNEDPSWAPDGRHIVFTKIRGGRSQLYLLDVLTKQQVQLGAIEGNASEAAWGP